MSNQARSGWLHSSLDQLTLQVFRRRQAPAPDAELARICDEAEVTLGQLQELGYLDDPRSAHPPPPAPDTAAIRESRARAGRVRYRRVSFPSAYTPSPDDAPARRWSALEPNRTVHAWVLRHREPRPWLVCLHGTSMGRPYLDIAFFRARWLHVVLGLNVAIPVLPLHGPRRSGLPSEVRFPSEDTLVNLHGTRQAVWDARRTVAMLRERQDDQPIGVFGVSLGGYIASLVASLEPGLACAIVGAPPVDLALLFEQHASGEPGGQRARNLGLAAELSRVVSPLGLEPLVRPGGRFIYAGVYDRMVDNEVHARRLWEHWDRPDALWYEASHTELAWHRPVGRYLARSLASAGMTTNPEPPSEP